MMSISKETREQVFEDWEFLYEKIRGKLWKEMEDIDTIAKMASKCATKLAISLQKPT